MVLLWLDLLYMCDALDALSAAPAGSAEAPTSAPAKRPGYQVVGRGLPTKPEVGMVLGGMHARTHACTRVNCLAANQRVLSCMHACACRGPLIPKQHECSCTSA